MASVVYVLAQGGILRAAEVVELAGVARLDIACAAVCLTKESGGGRNLWGSDAVDTGGLYVKGSTVTQATYRAYAAALVAGEVKAQGVGPTQLTYPPLQRRADARGECWDWRTNVAVGFEHLAGLIGTYGPREGFRRYNGSGPAAQRYADDAMSKLAAWRSRLAGATPVVITTPPTPAPRPTPEDDMPTAREIADAILDTPILRQGDRIPADLVGKPTTLRNELAWMTHAGINAAWSGAGPGEGVLRALNTMSVELEQMQARLAALEAATKGTP